MKLSHSGSKYTLQRIHKKTLKIFAFCLEELWVAEKKQSSLYIIFVMFFGPMFPS